MDTIYSFLKLLNTPFNKFYIFIIIILGIGFFLSYKSIYRQRTDEFIIGKTLYFLTISTLFNWLILFLSYQRLHSITPFDPVAQGGFPFVAFKYPHDIIGENYPPVEQWPLFFINLLCYATIALGFMYFFRQRIVFPTRYAYIPQTVAAITFVLLQITGLLYLRFQFD